MKKLSIGLLVIALLLGITACGGSEEPNPTSKYSKAPEGEVTTYSDMYIQVFDNYISQNQPLYSGMTYIAIDTAKLERVSAADVDAICSYLSGKYKVEIKRGSMNDLDGQGLVGANKELAGIFLTVDSCLFQDKTVSIEGTIFRSQDNQASYKSTLTFENNRWSLTGSTPLPKAE